MTTKVKVILLAAGLVLATFVAYAPALRGGFLWDDPEHVAHNDNLRTLDGLRRIWTVPKSLPQYYPLVHTSFWIEFQLWQLDTTGYHVVNVLLHVTSALLLWRVLRMLQIPGCWLAAAIFALHPVQVESVAWITERKNVLSAVFYLASAIAYLKFAEFDKRRRWYWIALGLFCCALLSKTVTATLPAAILVVLWWRRGRIAWRDAVPLIPFFIIGATMGLITAYLEQHFVGATGERVAELNLSSLQRILVAGRVIALYAYKLVWPYPLAFIYPRWEVDPRVWWQWLFPIGVIVTLVALFMLRHRIGRGPLAAALLFCGTLFPVLGFLNVYPMRFSFVADHFQYLASVGLIVLIAAGSKRFAGQFGNVVLIPLALLTFNRAFAYQDAETLWRDTLAKNPSSWMVRTNLGHVLRDRGAHREAFEQYVEALRLAPDLHDTHTNVGMMLGYWGENELAIKHFQDALRINPEFAPARYSLGLIYRRQDRVGEAEREFRLALQSAPQYGLAHFALAGILASRGEIDAAIEHYREAATYAGNDRDVRHELARALMAKQLWDEAAHNLERAIEIDPGFAEAWFDLARVLQAMGREEQALAAMRRAVELKPQLRGGSGGQ